MTGYKWFKLRRNSHQSRLNLWTCFNYADEVKFDVYVRTVKGILLVAKTNCRVRIPYFSFLCIYNLQRTSIIKGADRTARILPSFLLANFCLIKKSHFLWTFMASENCFPSPRTLTHRPDWPFHNFGALKSARRLHKIRRSPDLEALNLCKVPRFSCTYVHTYVWQLFVQGGETWTKLKKKGTNRVWAILILFFGLSIHPVNFSEIPTYINHKIFTELAPIN